MATQGGVIRKKGSKYYIYDAGSGRELLLKGYGTLRGRLEIDERIDLTKPIFEQIRKPMRAPRKRTATASVAAD